MAVALQLLNAECSRYPGSNLVTIQFDTAEAANNAFKNMEQYFARGCRKDLIYIGTAHSVLRADPQVVLRFRTVDGVNDFREVEMFKNRMNPANPDEPLSVRLTVPKNDLNAYFEQVKDFFGRVKIAQVEATQAAKPFSTTLSKAEFQQVKS